MEPFNFITLDFRPPVVYVTLNRPESHNALNGAMMAELTAAFKRVRAKDDFHAVVLTGHGHTFCAGADLAMMQASASRTDEENLAGSEAIFDLLLAVNNCPIPIVGRINGSAFGGGVGLVACCDIVIAVKRATFAFSEVRLGLIPAVIAPFVVEKIGLTNARELFLTGERFDAEHAQRIGLVHHLADEEGLDQKVRERLSQLLLGAPGAQRKAKELIRWLATLDVQEVRDLTTRAIAERRASDEGREGMGAFLEKRKPTWQDEASGQ